MSICKNNSFSSKITLSEAPTYNDAHNDARTTPFAMSLDATFGVETRGRKRRDANAGEAIPGLLNDIVVTHILRSEYFEFFTAVRHDFILRQVLRHLTFDV